MAQAPPDKWDVVRVATAGQWTGWICTSLPQPVIYLNTEDFQQLGPESVCGRAPHGDRTSACDHCDALNDLDLTPAVDALPARCECCGAAVAPAQRLCTPCFSGCGPSERSGAWLRGSVCPRLNGGR